LEDLLDLTEETGVVLEENAFYVCAGGVLGFVVGGVFEVFVF
jgi:hypothetical protein